MVYNNVFVNIGTLCKVGQYVPILTVFSLDRLALLRQTAPFGTKVILSLKYYWWPTLKVYLPNHTS